MVVQNSKKSPESPGYHVTQQRNKKPWPLLIKLLELNTKADTDRVRREVRRRIQI